MNLQDFELHQVYDALALEATSALQYAIWGGQVQDPKTSAIFKEVANHEMKHYKSLSQRWHDLGGTPLPPIDRMAVTAEAYLQGKTAPPTQGPIFADQEMSSFWYLWSALGLEEAASHSYELHGLSPDQNQKDLFYGLQKDEHSHIAYFQARLGDLSKDLGVAPSPPPKYRAPNAAPV